MVYVYEATLEAQESLRLLLEYSQVCFQSLVPRGNSDSELGLKNNMCVSGNPTLPRNCGSGPGEFF